MNAKRTAGVSSPSAARDRRGLRRALPYAGVVVGGWAIAAPYVLVGPDLDAEGVKEVADHVVPGLVQVALCTAVLLLARGKGRSTAPGSFPFVAGLGVLLAGIWMTATHLPLVGDARRGAVGDGVAAWHTAPGIAVVVLGLVWAALWWSADDEAR